MGPSGRGRPRSGKNLREVEVLEWWKDGSSPGMSLRRRGTLGWPGVMDAPNWTLRVVNFLGEALGNLGTSS